MSYLDELNPPQREAATHMNGAAMIIAGAGSGKTRVLTYRIAHLIEKGVDPFNILSLTFTNKASKEMRERIEKVIGSNARNIWMGTFHSVFARMLRSESERIGFPSNFTIYDMDDTKSLVRSIVKELNLDDKVYKANAVLSRISSAKNNLVSFAAYAKNELLMADDAAAQRPLISKIYKMYQERLFKADAMDFDDLLFNTSILLREFPDVLNKYQQRFKYVMIDEFQDTNLTQYYITKKLAAANQNIVIVGDDAQSIYAFRGANIQNILNFEKDYPELKVFKLEQNYRSTQTIVEAANSVIAKNSAQLKKNVWTSNDEGDLINLIGSQTDGEEAKLIANDIYENKVKKQEAYADYAILYRTNSQSRSIEEALRRLSLPYRIYGGLSFYQRKEIRDLIAYLRFTVNTNDEQALKRVINLPKRGIGDTSVAKVLVHANDKGISLWEALTQVRGYISGRTAMAIENFCILIRSYQVEAQSKDAFEVAQHIAKTSGLIKELYNDKSVEGLARYENVQELLNGVKGFVDNEEQEDKTLGAFLQEVSLLTDADATDENADHITLMTIHSSKGLEFKNVYLCGMEEDLFPSQMMLESRADLEEERRLFYVAVTRAEKSLTLSYALSRYRFGRQKHCEPSRFIEEIDSKFIRQKKKPKLEGNFGRDDDNVSPTGFSKNYSGLLKSVKKSNAQKTFKSTYKAPTDFVPDDTSSLAEGMKVEHPKFGFGTVKIIDAKGDSKKAIVNFDQVGEKTLLLSFAKLKIHS